MTRRALAATAGLLLCALAPQPAQDAAAKLRARDPLERLAAIDSLRLDGGKDAEKLLLGALDDKDWEVIERAALSLGERGTAASLPALSKVALEGPVRRIRVTAATALAKLDAKAAAELLVKAAKGSTLLRACEGLAAIAPICGEAAREGIELGLLSKDSAVRAAAAAGLAAYPPADRATQLQALLDEDDLTIGAAALEAVRGSPDPLLLPGLLAALARRDLPEVIERRVARAIVALFAATPAEARAPLAEKVLLAAGAPASDPALPRVARLIGLLAAEPAEGRLLPAADAVEKLAPILESGGEPAVAAATHALDRIGGEAAVTGLAKLAAGGRSMRVRSLALRGFARRSDPRDPAAAEVVKRGLADDDAQVREDAVVALGKPGVPGAVEALLPRLEDADWGVAVAAAVSLGKTQDPAALPALEQLAKHKDWKLAGAAVLGLGHLKQKAAVPLVIEALGSRSSTAKLTAFDVLRRLTRDKVPAKESNWKGWWTKNEPGFVFPDPAEVAKQQQKYGYAPSTYGVYEDLDVLVFQSRGDHIEQLLDVLKIEHRRTQGGNVEKSGVTPYGVYVANCTGECDPEDLEQVQWFVHAGGYLFCSCWALSFHAAQVRPGFARQHPTSTQVLDLVTAEPCAESPYLAGVFEGVTRPKYVLEGSHLIDVLDDERVEVLIDSPECATRWGCGNLAAWWTVGHGLILDSANHFDLQGFGRAPAMKTVEERMAYAIDVLGLSYSDWRDVPKAAWTAQTKAVDEVRDLSAFRFITNFVRQKRRADS